jgi:hypothetical protein
MDLDIGFSEIAALIASSTTNYLVKLAPLITFLAGLMLALGVMWWLVSRFISERFEKQNGGDTMK